MYLNKLLSNLKRISFYITILVISQNSNYISAATVNTDISMNVVSDGSIQYSNTAISTNAVGAATTSSALASEWKADYEQEIMIIPGDSIDIPIEIVKPSLILTHKDRGRFVFSDGIVRSVTRTPVLATNSSNIVTNYTFRPTLFVTIQGFHKTPADLLKKEKPGLDPWQNTFQTLINNIQNSTNARYSQIVHVGIDWDSSKNMLNQVKDVAGAVNHFLDQRTTDWDVVVIGYSRGGVFAHNLAKKIVNNSKINNMHTVLLDPTATSLANDFYPIADINRSKKSSSKTKVFASLYYDNKPFAPTNFSTVGDRPIPGYDNYGRGSADFLYTGSVDHADFADKWIATQTEQLLSDIWYNKVSGKFAQDGSTIPFDVWTYSEKSIAATVDISVSNGNLQIAASLSLGELPISSSLSFIGAVGEDGLAISMGLILTTAQLSINKDGLAVSQNILIASTAASLSSSGVNAQVNMLGAVAAGASIGSGDIKISAKLFGTTREISVKKSVNKLKKSVSKRAKKIWKKLGF